MNLTKIAEALRALADALETDEAGAPAEKPNRKPASKPASKPAKPAEEEVALPSREDVILAIQPLAKASRAAVDKLLADFNGKRVSDIPQERYPDLITAAKAALEAME